MRAFSLLAAAAICCVVGPVSISPLKAQTDQWFEFQVCNRSGIGNATVAILSKGDVNASTWHLEGWYNIPNNGCNDVGGYWRDAVYVYGMGDNGAVWNGSDSNQCVNLTARFERTVRGSYDCSNGETPVGMFKVSVPANVGTYTMNLQ